MLMQQLKKIEPYYCYIANCKKTKKRHTLHTMSLFDSFLSLTPELVSKVCSFTDDNTIYNLSVSSKALSITINIAKELIPVLRASEPFYDNYPLFKREPQHQHTTSISDTQLHIQNDTLIEDTHTFQTSHESSSVIILTAESQQEHNDQLSHLITSIRIKGCVTGINLLFADNIILAQEFPTTCLSPDEQGYIEILNPFAPFLPLFCVTHFETLLHIKSKGLVTVKVKKCRLLIHYINMMQWNNQPCNLPILKTNTIFTSVARAVKGQTHGICIPIQHTMQDNTSMGLYINIKNVQGEHINKKHIRAFIITWTDHFQQSHTYTNQSQFILSTRTAHVSTITNTPYYNLTPSTQFKHGFYIPLSTLHHYVSQQLQPPQHMHLKVLLKNPITTSPFTIDITHFHKDTLAFYIKNEDLHNEI